ncbi:MAG: DUF4118 domain-containing protein [Cyclobacteriaceae bacterium]|nr:DUF4118 domain-containing protein [Cyclobacteriaceae bacterium]
MPQIRQYLICSGMVLGVSLVCFYASAIIGYQVVSLILLMVVTVLAMLFDIMPVLLAALLSAVIWNYFFLPPLFTFHITNAADTLMFLLYFLIALVNAVLTFKIREAENKARDQEEKAHTIKLYNTLLHSLSHELRTPISTIVGSVDTLKEQQQQLTPVQQEQLLSEIEQAGLRLNRQVENLLNMSRLESGMLRLKLDWCDLNELVYQLFDKVDETHTHHLVNEAPEGLPLFKVDQGLLEQVLYNLLHNAVQYTPPGTRIAVMIRHIGNNCIIQVSDNGPGFTEQDRQRAFDKFYRSPLVQTGGSGLGLSIVKGFVEAHEGTITLDTAPGGGAQFTIVLQAEATYLQNLKHE